MNLGYSNARSLVKRFKHMIVFCFVAICIQSNRVAGDVNLCPMRINPDTNNSYYEISSSQSATRATKYYTTHANCPTNGDVSITLSPPMKLSATGVMTIEWVNARVSTGHLVLLSSSLTRADASERIPVIINIKKVTFNRDAAMLLQGPIPPSSIITLDGNTFTYRAGNSHSPFPLSYIAGFVFGNTLATGDTTYNELINTSIIFRNNIIQRTSATQVKIVTAVLLASSIEMTGANSSIVIVGNTMTCEGLVNEKCSLFDTYEGTPTNPRSIKMLYPNSLLLIAGNILTSPVPKKGCLANFNAIDGSGRSTLPYGGSRYITDSLNALTSSYGIIIASNIVAIQGQMAGQVIMFQSISNLAHLEIRNNTFRSNVGISIRAANITTMAAPSSSTLLLVANVVSYTAATSVPPLLVLGTASFQFGTQMIVMNNHIRYFNSYPNNGVERNSSTSYAIISLTTFNKNMVTVWHCGNTVNLTATSQSSSIAPIRGPTQITNVVEGLLFQLACTDTMSSTVSHTISHTKAYSRTKSSILTKSPQPTLTLSSTTSYSPLTTRSGQVTNTPPLYASLSRTPTVSLSHTTTSSASLTTTATFSQSPLVSFSVTPSISLSHSFESLSFSHRSNMITKTTSRSLTISSSIIKTNTTTAEASKSIDPTLTLTTLFTQSPPSWDYSPSAYSFTMDLTPTLSFTNSVSQDHSSSTSLQSSITLVEPPSISNGRSVSEYPTYTARASSTRSLIPVLPVLELLHAPIAPQLSTTFASVSAVGSATAALDVQTTSVMAISSCSRAAASGSSELYRSLSPFALSMSCDGVALGNALFLGAAACVLLGAAASARLLSPLLGRGGGSWVAALALVRCPSLLFLALSFVLNSFAVCGVEYVRGGRAGAGLVLLGVALSTVGSYPVSAHLFGSRRYSAVVYSRRRCWVRAAAVVALPAGYLEVQDDGAEDHLRHPVAMFGSVVGAYQRQSPLWTLVGSLSAVASWPCLVPSHGSPHCFAMFGLSAALHFGFALALLALRPRRVLLGDVWHAIALVLNGTVVCISAVAVRLGTEDAYAAQSAAIGDMLMLLSALRLAHSAVVTLHRPALARLWPHALPALFEMSEPEAEEMLEQALVVKGVASVVVAAAIRLRPVWEYRGRLAWLFAASGGSPAPDMGAGPSAGVAGVLLALDILGCDGLACELPLKACEESFVGDRPLSDLCTVSSAATLQEPQKATEEGEKKALAPIYFGLCSEPYDPNPITDMDLLARVRMEQKDKAIRASIVR